MNASCGVKRRSAARIVLWLLALAAIPVIGLVLVGIGREAPGEYAWNTHKLKNVGLSDDGETFEYSNCCCDYPMRIAYFAELGKEKKLKSANIHWWPVAGEILRDICQASELRDLKLGWNDRLNDGEVKHFLALKKLQRLSLYGTPITSQAGDTLSQIESLVELDVCDTAIDDEFLFRISTLPNLQKLYLEDTQATDAGLELLGRMPKLTWVSIAGSRVTKRGVTAFNERAPRVHVTTLVRRSFQWDYDTPPWQIPYGASSESSVAAAR